MQDVIKRLYFKAAPIAGKIAPNSQDGWFSKHRSDYSNGDGSASSQPEPS